MTHAQYTWSSFFGIFSIKRARDQSTIIIIYISFHFQFDRRAVPFISFQQQQLCLSRAFFLRLFVRTRVFFFPTITANVGTLLFLLSLSFNTKIDSGVVLVFIVCIFYTSLWILKKNFLWCVLLARRKLFMRAQLLTFWLNFCKKV